MPPSSVGPVPLLGGVQLEPARGRPTGLLDVLNMEPRDGMLRTRRGQGFAGYRIPAFSSIAMERSPSSWASQTVTYLGETTTGTYRPGGLARIDIAAVVEETADVQDLVIEFWGEDNDWHRLAWFDAARQQWSAGATLKFGTYSTSVLVDQNEIIFIVPHGWKEGTPTGTALASNRRWLRFTRTTAWSASVSFGAFFAYLWHDEIQDDCDSNEHAFAFVSRAGPRAIIALSATVGTGISYPVWRLLDVDSGGLLDLGAFDEIQSLRNQRPLGVYMAATDDFLFWFGEQALVSDCSAWWTAPTAFSFDDSAALSGTAYEDIPVDTSLPSPPTFLAVFEDRLFMGLADGTIRWTAPAEYWTVLPSLNVRRLQSQGAGRPVAMVPFGNGAAIFTTTGIWSVTGTATADGDASYAFGLIEDTACLSGASVVAIPGGVVFLSDDGIRIFDGNRSRLVSGDVETLFDERSGHPMAVSRPERSVAVWDRKANQYQLYYSTPGSPENNAAVVVDLGDGTCWLWGADQPEALGTSGSTGPIGQVKRGVRGTAAVWHPGRQAVVLSDRAGVVGILNESPLDIEAPIEWRFETHHSGMGSDRRQVLTKVTLAVELEHFDTVKVTAIADGRERGDSRTVRAERDGDSSSSALGAADAAGQALVATQVAIVPIHARFRSAAWNHRLRVESVAEDHDPIALVAMTYEVTREGSR